MAKTTDTPRKSDRTRAAILAAAREQFAAKTYDMVSIRAVATQAAIDPAMVIRYFTNKETLFATAVDIDLQLPDLSDWPTQEWGSVLAAHFFDLWEGAQPNAAAAILLRSAVTHEDAAQRVREIFTVQARGMLENVAQDAADAERRAGLVASQIIGLIYTRYMLRLPGLADRPSDDLIADVAPTLQRYLAGHLPKRAPAGAIPCR